MLLVSLVIAQALPAPQTAHPAPVAAPPAKERRICRAEATTGSIMPAHRVCHTASEWAAIDAANGRSVDSFRNRQQNGVNPGQ